MRLIHVETLTLKEFSESSVPPYAILSHTWEDGEVSFQVMQDLTAKSKWTKLGFTSRHPKQNRSLDVKSVLKGLSKIQHACEQARKDGLDHVWVDTCCIDKSSSAELQEAINSIYRWYSEAAVCYVYLSDIDAPLVEASTSFFPGVSEHENFILTVDRQPFTNSRWFKPG